MNFELVRFDLGSDRKTIGRAASAEGTSQLRLIKFDETVFLD